MGIEDAGGEEVILEGHHDLQSLIHSPAVTDGMDYDATISSAQSGEGSFPLPSFIRHTVERPEESHGPGGFLV